MNARTLILCLTCFFFSKLLFAQPLVDDTQTYEILVFEHVEKEQTRFVRVGGWIKYKLYSNPKMTYKGTLQKVTDKSFFVDGHEVMLADCSMIAGRVRSQKELTGGILLGMGLATGPFGGTLLSFTIAGPAVIVTGAVMIGVGIYLITQKKHFRMDKGWSVHGGTLRFSRSHN